MGLEKLGGRNTREVRKAHSRVKEVLLERGLGYVIAFMTVLKLR